MPPPVGAVIAIGRFWPCVQKSNRSMAVLLQYLHSLFACFYFSYRHFSLCVKFTRKTDHDSEKRGNVYPTAIGQLPIMFIIGNIHCCSFAGSACLNKNMSKK